MDLFDTLRAKLKGFISRHEVGAVRVLRALLCLFGLLSVRTCFYEGSVLDNPFLVMVVTLIGGFVPLSAVTLIIVFSAVVHLASISTQVVLVVIGLLMMTYLLLLYYQADNRYYTVFSAVFYQMRIPFCVPMAAGMFGNINEVVSIISGSVLGFYLRLLVENKAILKDPNAEISAFSLLFDQMLRSQLFYCYVAANVAMFLIVYLVKRKNIQHSAALGVSFGSLASFAIMLTGNLFFSSGENLLKFVVEILVTFLIGIITSYFFVEMDYNRPESLQFEDDDYYYYVTAIPKVRLTKEEWKVKRITGNDLELDRKDEDIE
jgi:hypothetical protein